MPESLLVSLSARILDRDVPQIDLQIRAGHWDVTGILGSVIDDGFGGKYLLAAAAPADWQFGATRGWHFCFRADSRPQSAAVRIVSSCERAIEEDAGSDPR